MLTAAGMHRNRFSGAVGLLHETLNGWDEGGWKVRPRAKAKGEFW